MSGRLHRPGRVLAAVLCLAGIAAAGCSASRSAEQQHTSARAEGEGIGRTTGDAVPSAPSYGRGAPPLGTPPERLSRTVHDKTVMVVGDSWAANLGQGMSAVTAGHSTVVNAGLGGCGIRLPEGDDVPERCNGWQKTWPSYLKKYQPDASVLVVGYWDVEPQRMKAGEEPKDLTSPPYRAAFTAHLRRAVDLLTASGRPVYLVTSPLVTKPQVSGSAQAMNQVLREVDRQRTDVRLLDVTGQLCNDVGCPAEINGTSVYDPTMHLAPKARDRIAAWALNSIFAPA
ncbi:SGNH hydrolase domain-containing protein (plasmid) [Streptomyces sp. R39]|uniref:SGNH hydrolase domain-containing protein n=1 Tax=Streptomyces sp. R39 TaxID=3238631 RepID=A0AB39R8Z0_9ACTN